LKHFLLFILAFSFKLAFAQSPDLGNVASVESPAAVESSLKIFPNPAKNSLMIHMRLPNISQSRISLHDMLGNEVELLTDNAAGQFEKSFDISSVRTGIYFVRIAYNNGQNTIVRKIVVQ
jgi:hypothetical protein